MRSIHPQEYLLKVTNDHKVKLRQIKKYVKFHFQLLGLQRNIIIYILLAEKLRRKRSSFYILFLLSLNSDSWGLNSWAQIVLKLNHRHIWLLCWTLWSSWGSRGSWSTTSLPATGSWSTSLCHPKLFHWFSWILFKKSSLQLFAGTQTEHGLHLGPWMICFLLLFQKSTRSLLSVWNESSR